MSGYDISDGCDRPRGTDRTARLCYEIAIEARRSLRLREGLERCTKPSSNAASSPVAVTPGRSRLRGRAARNVCGLRGSGAGK